MSHSNKTSLIIIFAGDPEINHVPNTQTPINLKLEIG